MIELGAGTGIVGILAALQGAWAARAVATCRSRASWERGVVRDRTSGLNEPCACECVRVRERFLRALENTRGVRFGGRP